MIDAFEPAPRLANGHVMTLWTWARRRQFPGLSAPVARIFEVAPGIRVSADCHWQDVPQDHPTLLALHGLEGSSQAHYMGGMADKAWRAGFNVVRLNQRNCGGTENLCNTLYHSGLTADATAVLRELVESQGLRSLAVAGYSLGGNLALKLAAEWSDAGPGPLHAVCAVSPTMDLERCVRALERRANYAYQWNFVRNLKARMRRKISLFPDRFSSEPLDGVRTVREFDEVYTAPHFGFRDATDYYYRASAMRVVDRIRVPTLIIAAADDPFVPVDPFSDPAVTGNPNITVHLSPHGGHCAFLTRGGGGDDGYWAERQIVRWAERHCAAKRDAASYSDSVSYSAIGS